MKWLEKKRGSVMGFPEAITLSRTVMFPNIRKPNSNRLTGKQKNYGEEGGKDRVIVSPQN